MKWKVYRKTWYAITNQEIIQWDGKITEAETERQAISRGSTCQPDYGQTFMTFVYAIPEEWELPVNVNYIQKEMF